MLELVRLLDGWNGYQTSLVHAVAPLTKEQLNFDGLLTLGLFKRILICHTDHFVVLEPR